MGVLRRGQWLEPAGGPLQCAWEACWGAVSTSAIQVLGVCLRCGAIPGVGGYQYWCVVRDELSCGTPVMLGGEVGPTALRTTTIGHEYVARKASTRPKSLTPAWENLRRL